MEFLYSEKALATKIGNATGVKITPKQAKLLRMAYLWGYYDVCSSIKIKMESKINTTLSHIKIVNIKTDSLKGDR